MPELKPRGMPGRVHETILCGMLCALEIRGYLMVRAGQTVLDIPRSWMILFGGYCVWICWSVLIREYSKRGLPSALVVAGVEGFGIYGLREFLMGIAGHKILDPPSEVQMVLFVAAIVLLPWFCYAGKIGSKVRLGFSDRLACLTFAIYFATKMGMVKAVGADAIMLKGVGCIALGTGTFLMILGVLNALSPDESEFPAVLDSPAAQVIPQPKAVV